MRKKFAILLAATACFVGACGSGDNDGGSGSVTVKIGLSGTTLSSNTPMFTAFGSGYVAEVEDELNVKFELVPMSSGNDMMTALSVGELDMCICNSFQVMKVSATRDDLRSLFNMYDGAGFAYVSRKGLDVDPSDLSSLDDTTFGYSREGSTGQAYGIELLRQNDLTFKDDVKGVALGSTDAGLAALTGKRADWIASDTFAAAVAVDGGIGTVFHNANDRDDYGPVLGKLLGNGLVSTEKFIGDHEEITQGLVSALVHGLTDVQDNFDDKDAVLESTTKEFQEARAERPSAWTVEWELVGPAFATNDGMFSDEELADTAEFGRVSGALESDEAKADLSKTFINDYAERAYTDLGLDPVK